MSNDEHHSTPLTHLLSFPHAAASARVCPEHGWTANRRGGGPGQRDQVCWPLLSYQMPALKQSRAWQGMALPCVFTSCQRATLRATPEDIYFHQRNADEHHAALELRDAVLRLRRDGAFVAVPLFRVNTDPIGPHPVGEFIHSVEAFKERIVIGRYVV